MRLETLTYSQLRYNPAINARGSTETDLTELCATLKSKGIGQPLLVRPSDDGSTYEPVEGGRRFHAIGRLISEGHLPAEYPIPVLVRDLSDTEAMELSIATAVTRVPLNPADEAVAFAKLVEGGIGQAEIAAHFGVTERRVKQRLAIAQLPEKIVKALRAGEISIEAAQAFTLGRDKSQVEKLFKEITKASADSWHRRSDHIRRRLLEKRVAATSREAQFVGVDAYREAGGVVDEDLFSNNAWFADGKLLQKLFAKKLKTEQDRLLSEGWSFAEIDENPGYGSKFKNWSVLAPDGKLSADQKATIKELEEKRREVNKALHTMSGDLDEDDRAAELIVQQDVIDAQIATIKQSTFTEQQRAKSGVLIELHHEEVKYRYGLMEPKAAKKNKAAKKSKQKASATGSAAGKRNDDEAEADFTGALNTEMAKAMTVAMQWAITNKVGLAKRALAVVLAVAATGHSGTPFHLAVEARWTAPVAELRQHLADKLKELAAHAGSDGVDELIAEATKLSDADADNMLAEAFALSFAYQAQILDDRRVLSAFDPDVSAVWEPTEEFFKRMPRESLAAALGEAGIPGATPSKKKKELIEMCVGQLLPVGWLPKPLRTPSYKGPGSNAWADAKAAQLADEVSQQQAAE